MHTPTGPGASNWFSMGGAKQLFHLIKGNFAYDLVKQGVQQGVPLLMATALAVWKWAWASTASLPEIIVFWVGAFGVLLFAFRQIENWWIRKNPQPMSSLQVYTGRVMVDFNNLSDEGYLVFQFCVVCGSVGLTIEKAPHGNISCRIVPVDTGQAEEGDKIELDTPQILSDSGYTLRQGESFIEVKQHVPRKCILEIEAALEDEGKKLEFYFDNLRLPLLSSGVEVGRVNLWAGVTCQHGLCFNPIVESVTRIEMKPIIQN